MTPTPEQNAKRETLKPCPFCGHQQTDSDKHDHIVNHHDEGYAIHALACSKCGAVGPFGPEDDIEDAWNKRTPDPDELRQAADGMAKERNELSRTIEDAHHIAMIDWPGSEVPILSQVESLFSALKEHYNDKIEALRAVADGLRDSLVECRKDSLFIHARNPQFEEPAKRHAQATAALAAYRALAGEGGKG